MTHDAENILSLIQPRFESAESARIWFEEQSIPGFSGQTARQLVEAGRVAEVLDYIAAVDAGIYA